MADRVIFCTLPQEAGGIQFIHRVRRILFNRSNTAHLSEARLKQRQRPVSRIVEEVYSATVCPTLRSAMPEALLEEVQRFCHDCYCIQLQNSDNPVNVSGLVNYLHR